MWCRFKALARVVLDQVFFMRKLRRDIMSAITDYTDVVVTKLNDISTHVDGVAGDVATLNQKIADLTAQLATSGNLSDADKAALQAVVDQAGVVDGKVSALDAATDPAQVPVPPPATEEIPAG